MLSFLLSPIGRYIALAVVALGLATYGIHKLKQEAVQEVERKAIQDALRRTQDAVRAGDAVDLSPDGLLKSDGHRRD